MSLPKIYQQSVLSDVIRRGSYMSAHVLLNLLNEFRNEFNKFNNTRARMLDSIYHMTNTLKSHFWRKTL